MITGNEETRNEGIHVGGGRAKWPRAWNSELGRTGFDSGSATDLHNLFNISVPQFSPAKWE